MPTVFRYRYLSDLGYVVYRHLWTEVRELEDLLRGIWTLREAVFVEEAAAQDYCHYRNRLLQEHGTDLVPPIRTDRPHWRRRPEHRLY